MITGAQIIIDGVDQSANLTGVVQINLEEGKARTATFNLRISGGVAVLVGWVNKSVVIKSDIDSTIKTEFTGVIDTPPYDVETGLTAFTCTDNLQESFETQTKTQIDAVITPAYWSEAVFNDSDGWEYAQERLSTVPSALDMDELKAIRLTDWAAKTTADYTFTDAGHIYGTLKNDAIANRRNIINAVDITLDYRYSRLKERQQAYSWSDSGDQCDLGIFETSYPVPSKQRVLDAINGTGWEIVADPVWTLTAPTNTYLCGLTTIVWIQNPDYVQGVTFTIGKRYSQTITENYSIRVESADSIAAMGEIAVIQNASVATAYDLTDWNDSLIADGWSNFGTTSTDINGDLYVNKDDTTERSNATDTIVNVAKTRILESHRNTLVSFEIPYHQNIDLIHTAEIDTSKIHAKGKVKTVVKTIDTFSGLATCIITISLSKKFGVGTQNPEDAPSIPDALPTVTDTQTVSLSLLSHLGGQSSTVYDSTWSGWIVDYLDVTEPGHTPYPKEFVVHTPAITLNSLDNFDAPDSSLLNVTIPDDTLT